MGSVIVFVILVALAACLIWWLSGDPSVEEEITDFSDPYMPSVDDSPNVVVPPVAAAKKKRKIAAKKTVKK